MSIEPEIPSKEFNEEWIWAKTEPFESQKRHDYSGKWMIFASLERLADGLTMLDRLWIRLQAETMRRKFYKASARTSKETRLSRDDYGVICVHTTDHRDEGEVLLTGIKIIHIIKAMKISLHKPLAYKTYNETLNKDKPGPNLYKLDYSYGKIEFLKFNPHFDDYEVIFESKFEEALFTLLPNSNGREFKEMDYLKELNESQTERQNILKKIKEKSESSKLEIEKFIHDFPIIKDAVVEKRKSFGLPDKDDEESVDAKKFKN